MKLLVVSVVFSLYFFCIVPSLHGINVYQSPQDYLEMYDDYYYYNGDDDLSWIDNTQLVVKDGQVESKWKKDASNQIREDKWTSISYFIIDIDIDIKEQFGPLAYGIVGAPEKTDETDAGGHSDETLSIITTGDAIFGNLEEEDDVYFLKVNYYCFKPGTSQVFVSIPLIDVLSKEEKIITFYWMKECGSGPRQGFEILVAESPEITEPDDETDISKTIVVSDGETLSTWSYANPEHKLLVSRWVTEFFISIREGYGSQTYNAPKIECSDESIVKVHLGGQASVTNIISETEIFHRLKIVHICASTVGEAKVSVSIGLGSFNEIKFSWIKSCEHSITTHLSIKTSPHAMDDPDVVKEGITRDSWRVENPQKKIPIGEVQSEFYLSSTATGVITFSQPAISVKPSHMLKAEIDGTSAYGGTIFQDSDTELFINYKCLQKGNAVVRVTIPISEHQDPVDFSFIKECPKYVKKKKPHSAYLTADRAMLLFCFTVLIIGLTGAYFYINIKRRREAARRARIAQLNSYD